MAKASIKLVCEKCGREFVHEKICYNRSDANNYEDWASRNITICPDCYKAEMQAAEAKKRAEQSAEAAEEAKKLSLPALTGSEKQVAWANTLRHKMLVKYGIDHGFANGKTIDDLKSILDDCLSGKIQTTESDIHKLQMMYAAWTETSAKWFIDHR